MVAMGTSLHAARGWTYARTAVTLAGARLRTYVSLYAYSVLILRQVQFPLLESRDPQLSADARVCTSNATFAYFFLKIACKSRIPPQPTSPRVLTFVLKDDH